MAAPKQNNINIKQLRTVIIVAAILAIFVLVKNYAGVFKGPQTASNQPVYNTGPVTTRGEQQTATSTPANSTDQATQEQLTLYRSINSSAEAQVQPQVFNQVNKSLGFNPNTVSTDDPFFYIRMALVGLGNNNPYVQQLIIDGQNQPK